MKKFPITIVTGKAGSGKRTALAVFEDSGYYCVDNMPVALLPCFFELPDDYLTHCSGLVFGMDLRDSQYVREYNTIFDALISQGYRLRIIFLDADETALLRRYSQTRRKHPLAMNKSMRKAILAEKDILEPLRRCADHVIDTSELNVHELKAIIRKIADAGSRHTPMTVQILSFGYRYGLPAHADLVMDVRFLKNPYFDEELRPLSGESEKIRSFVLNNDQTCLFLHKYFDLLDVLIPQYENEGKAYLTIAVGCTGGRHRSVVIADTLCKHITTSGREAELAHRDIEKFNPP